MTDVLLLGGTGRTGGRVLRQLLGRGVHVRAVVRSAERLPAGVAGDPRLSVVVADLLSMSDQEVRGQLGPSGMGELAADCDVWATWQGKSPVILNASPA